MPQQQRERERPRTASTAIITEGPGEAGDEQLCTCCVPPNPLVLRPDLGLEPDGRARWALCAFHLPEPTVYRLEADGHYRPVAGHRLNELGELVDSQGALVARVLDDGFQRLTTIDDDPPPDRGGPSGGAARPLGGERPAISTTRIDLSQDEFYRSPGLAGPCMNHKATC